MKKTLLFIYTLFTPTKKHFHILSLLVLFSFTSVHSQKNKSNIFKELFGVSVSEHKDKFEGTTTYKMYGNKVHLDNAGVSALSDIAFKSAGMDLDLKSYKLFMNLENHITKNEKSQLSIVFRIVAYDELFVDIKEGESLKLILGNNNLDLSTNGSFNSDMDIENESSITNARYNISKETLEKIINSEEVSFRLILHSYSSGESDDRDNDKLNLDGTFRKKNFKAWKEFYHDYVNNNNTKD